MTRLAIIVVGVSQWMEYDPSYIRSQMLRCRYVPQGAENLGSDHALRPNHLLLSPIFRAFNRLETM